MNKRMIPSFALAMAALACLAAPASAADRAAAEQAIVAAQSAQADALKRKNRWTTTDQALVAARKAMAENRFDEALAAAREAEALATASVEQSRLEETRWRDAVIR